jgi:hypothetical protein
VDYKVDYERKKIRKTVTENLKYYLDEVSIDDAIMSLQTYKRDLEEKGFLDLTLSINIAHGYYDDHHIEIHITGAELETDKEYARRIKSEEVTEAKMVLRKAKQEIQAAESERKLYEKLKKKFEKAGQK